MGRELKGGGRRERDLDGPSGMISAFLSLSIMDQPIKK